MPVSLLRFPLRIKNALRNRLCLLADYLRYRRRFLGYRALIPAGALSRGKVLFIAGRGMNIGWAQMWTFLSLAFAQLHVQPCVLLFRKQRIIRLYFGLVGAQCYFLDDRLGTHTPFDASQFARCNTVEQWEALRYHNMPLGQMVLSTYCRYHATGLIDPTSPALKSFAADWVQGLCRAYDAAAALYRDEAITTAMFSETFIEEYGGFYFAALQAGLEIIKTSGTVRDNAILAQKRRLENVRLHHAALTERAWQQVKALPDYAAIKRAVDQNFSDRYGNKWFRSSRNQKGTAIVSREEGRQSLGIPDDRKVVIIYSHILYDALFHYGDELFQDYATWLLETTKIAIENPKVDWYIKLHPSNIWRGEFKDLLGGKYEEEKVLADYVAQLPPHVKLIYADTKISPFGWYQIADYGICVRGTAGLEMACLGKPVITAGTGRYEGNGFTVDPATKAEYRDILLNLPALPTLTEHQTELATRYAHGLFNMKPFTLSSLETTLAFGKKKVMASDDIAYIPKPYDAAAGIPPDLKRFADFLDDPAQMDLLTYG